MIAVNSPYRHCKIVICFIMIIFKNSISVIDCLKHIRDESSVKNIHNT